MEKKDIYHKENMIIREKIVFVKKYNNSVVVQRNVPPFVHQVSGHRSTKYIQVERKSEKVGEDENFRSSY